MSTRQIVVFDGGPAGTAADCLGHVPSLLEGNVSAARVDEIGGWQVSVWVMEFVRSDPMETQLRQHVIGALRGVGGVTSAAEHDRETWFVSPGGLDGRMSE